MLQTVVGETPVWIVQVFGKLPGQLAEDPCAVITHPLGIGDVLQIVCVAASGAAPGMGLGDASTAEGCHWTIPIPTSSRANSNHVSIRVFKINLLILRLLQRTHAPYDSTTTTSLRDRTEPYR